MVDSEDILAHLTKEHMGQLTTVVRTTKLNECIIGPASSTVSLPRPPSTHDLKAFTIEKLGSWNL
jgi:hypothetical protein